MNFLFSVVSFDMTPAPPSDIKSAMEYKESPNWIYTLSLILLILGGILYGLRYFIPQPTVHHPTPVTPQATAVRGEVK